MKGVLLDGRTKERTLLLLTVCILGIISGIKSLYVIVILLAGSIMYLNFFKTELMCLLTITTILAFPNAGPFFDLFNLYIPIIKLNFFSIELIILVSVVTIKLLIHKKSLGHISRFIPYFLFVATIIIYIFVGLIRGNPYIRPDTEMYIYYSVYIICSVLFVDKKYIETIIKIFILSSILIAITIIIAYFFRNSFFTSWLVNNLDGDNLRFGTGNQTIFAIVLPLTYIAIKFKLVKEKWLTISKIAIPLMLISMVIDEGRVLFVSVVFNFLVVYTWFWFKSKNIIHKKLLNTMLAVLFIISLLGMSNYLLQENSKIGSFKSRIIKLADISEVDSLSTRNVTNSINLRKINQKPMGYGIGKPIGLYNSRGGFERYGTFVDNAIITVMYKIGYVGIFIFALFYSYEILKIFTVARQKNDNNENIIAIVVLLCMPVYLINSAYFSAQLVKNFAVNSLTMIIFAIIGNYLNIRTTEGTEKL